MSHESCPAACDWAGWKVQHRLECCGEGAQLVGPNVKCGRVKRQESSTKINSSNGRVWGLMFCWSMLILIYWDMLWDPWPRDTYIRSCMMLHAQFYLVSFLGWNHHPIQTQPLLGSHCLHREVTLSGLVMLTLLVATFVRKPMAVGCWKTVEDWQPNFFHKETFTGNRWG